MPRVLVTGAAGFVGSHLVARLLADGFAVVGVDNLISGRRVNVARFSGPEFEFVEADADEVTQALGHFDWILHLASPASPRVYLAHPIETLRASGATTLKLLELASRDGSGFMLASSSEVYGDPEVHPQPETYVGRVDVWSPRSVYQEAKRYGEAVAAAHARLGTNVRVARIFNAYGPGMRSDDGRVVPTFIANALMGSDLPVQGDGSQTRSLQYVDDLVDGLRRLMDSDYRGPVNLGNPVETSIGDLAAMVIRLTGSISSIVNVPAALDDPRRRCPDISTARRELGWQPRISLEDGLTRTITWFARELQDEPQASVQRGRTATAG